MKTEGLVPDCDDDRDELLEMIEDDEDQLVIDTLTHEFYEA